MKSHLSITSRMQIDPTEWAGNSQGLFSKYLTDKESRECRWTHRKEELVQLCPTFTHLVWDRIKLCCGVTGTEGKELLCNWDCVALVTPGRSRNFSVLSLPCSLLAFSSGTPPATSFDEIPRSKELMPKEPWADWADLCLLKIQRNDHNNIRKTNKKKSRWFCLYFAPVCRSFSGCLKAMLPRGSLGLWNIWWWRTPERELYMKSFLKA